MNSIDPVKKRILNDYLDESFHGDSEQHPFLRFDTAEIVFHETYGYGIVTGYRMPDVQREFTGLGIQFVQQGCMKEHIVFTPEESAQLTATGVVFNAKIHRDLTLEDLVEGVKVDRSTEHGKRKS